MKNKLMISTFVWMLLIQIILPFGMSARVYAEEMPEEEIEIVEEPDESIEEQEKTSTETVVSKNVSENTTEKKEEKISKPPTSSVSETETSEFKEIEQGEKSTETTSEEQESVEEIETEESEETSEEIMEQPTTLTFETEELKVEVSGEPGVIPEGTELVVEPVSDEDTEIYLEAIEQKNDTPINSAALFDITLLDEKGNIIQPNGEVTVKFYGLNYVSEDDNVFVKHVEIDTKSKHAMKNEKDSFSENEVDTEDFNPLVEDEEVSFKTDHFSIYIVGTDISHSNSKDPYQMFIGETIRLEERTEDRFLFHNWKGLPSDAISIDGYGAEVEITAIKEGKVTVKYKTDGVFGLFDKYNYFYINIVEDKSDPVEKPITDPNALPPGTVTAEKTAKWVDYKNRIAEINLSVEGTPAVFGSDIILVMGISASMAPGKANGFTDRMEATKEASNLFINRLLGNENKLNNRVAFIPFSHGITDTNWPLENTYPGGTSPEEVAKATKGSKNFTYDTDLLAAFVKQTKAEGGTNYSAALKKANEFVDSRSSSENDRPVHVVFMSDSAPGPYGNSVNDESWNGKKQADILKDKGATIHTVGIQLEGKALKAMQQISSNNHRGKPLYQNVSDLDDLAPVLESISGKINAAGTNAKFTNYLSKYFNYYSESQYVGDGEYIPKHHAVEIQIDDITEETKKYTIYAQLKDEYWHSEELKHYPTNNDIQLDYTDINGNDVTQNKKTIGNSELPVVFGTINRMYALVDSEGNYIKQSDGSKTYIPIESDSKNYKQSFLINGSHLLDIEQKYKVPAVIPNGYVLFSQDQGMKEKELTYENRETASVEFRVVLETTDFSFTKVDQNGNPLKGATFTLENHKTDGTVSRIENSGSGSKFRFNHLTEGVYVLTETKAPPGYRLPIENTWQFKVSNSSGSGGLEIAFEGQELEKNYNGYIIPNSPQGELPQTGGVGTLGFMIVGITIMLSSLIYYKKKDNESFKNNGGNNNE